MRNPIEHFAEAIRSSYEPGVDDPWWYDNGGHFISGAVIGALVHSLGASEAMTILLFLGAAVVWEIFEYSYRIRPWDPRENWSTDRAIEDTLLDTYVGLTGAIIVLVIL